MTKAGQANRPQGSQLDLHGIHLPEIISPTPETLPPVPTFKPSRQVTCPRVDNFISPNTCANVFPAYICIHHEQKNNLPKMNIETIAAIIGTAAPVAALILGLSWERKAARILRERHAAKLAQRAAITGANWQGEFSNRATTNNQSK